MSEIGPFLGKAGTLEPCARETMLACAVTDALSERALATRYRAR